MNIIHTILLGVVEGVTEFLPISSTAHMDIVRALLSVPSSSFVKSFEIIIQLGAIMAVIVLYAKKVFTSFKYFRNLIIAFIPTGIIGFVLYKIVKSLFLGNLYIEASALLIGGIVIILFENYRETHKGKKTESLSVEQSVETLSVRQLITLGVAQALAVIPGVSRSGAVIVCGRVLGLENVLITEFSFLLAVPTMMAAAAYDIYKTGFSFSGSEWGTVFLGFVVAFITALIVIKWLLSYIKKHSFKIFGWYRIVMAIILIIAIYLKVI